MGTHGFWGEARAPAQSCIVQKRNKAVTYFNVTKKVSDVGNVHHRQTYGGIPVSHLP